MIESIKNGYVPHDGADHFTCAKCGNGLFTCMPQTVVTDAKIWTFEFKCTRCGHIMLMDERNWRIR